MNRVVRALLPLLLWACGPGELPAPTILSVMPEQLPLGSPSALSVKVDAVRPFSLDYSDQSVNADRLEMAVQLAGQPVHIAFVDHDGTLILPVPEDLTLGAHDIRVTLADGREAVRQAGFSIVPPQTLEEPDDRGGPIDEEPGKDGPDGKDQDGVFAFWVDPIRDQVRNVPFRVTLRAMGWGAKRFQGPLTIRSSRGKVEVVTQGAFSEGVRTMEISLSQHGHGVYLMVEDARGRRGLSNPFDVDKR